MICAGCRAENREGRKFCAACGARLAVTCPGCGAANEPGERFCGECGGALAAPAAEAAGARKVVTIVFGDLVGSTALHERLDPESARRFMESYYRAMRGAVEAHGGTVTQLLGDGVKAVFGIPRVAEDDAIRAVRAAVEMQRAFRELASAQRDAVGKTGLRVAVNTGEVVSNDASEIIGDPVNVAARLQEQARDGDVVIGESTEQLVASLVTLESLGRFTLKGRSVAVSAYRVTSLERPAGVAATPFVGRDTELARLATVYAAAIEKPATCLAVLLGSPGLGKSRLIDEFARRRGEAANVLSAHCDAAGGASFAPLAEALRGFLGLDDATGVDGLRASLEAIASGDDAERARIVSGITALLSGSPASPEETFFVVRRLLSSIAATKPVVLVIDDLHWAEPLLLDLVEHLVQWGGGVPLLVLVGARPELRDARSSLATRGGLVADVVTLAGLDAGAATRLAANLIGAADLPAAVAAKVLAASEGNPLFVGELVRMLVHEGALLREGDHWTTGVSLAALEMPPTIHALLAARIERLRPEERTVLERAAVVGRHFSRSAIAELLPRDVTDLDARLESLRRAELIESDSGWFLGEPALRFHHVLIRDAAYRRLLKGTRAELHARFANWIELRAGDAVEHDETLGWHLEQAHQLLGELGPIDAQGRALGERAARRLAAAGRRALARDDLPLAAGLLGRALDRLDVDDASRAELALDWCEALLSAGDVVPAAAALDELGRFVADSPRLRAWQTCFAGQLTVLIAPQALQTSADAVAGAAESLASLGDDAGEAKAHHVHAQALQRLGKVGAAEAALDRALAAARRVGDTRRSNAVLAGAPLAALWGPSAVTRASGRCLDVVRVLRITQGAPAVEAVALSCQGVLEALRGRADAARRMIASSRKLVEELGITHRLLEVDVFAGRIDVLEGDAPAAERSLRPAYEGLRELGLGIDAARAAALLARALLAQGRAAEAEALSHESEALAGDDLQAAIAWRGVRAEALAQRGEHAAAIELARTAVAIASATDALLDHADARLALAAALRAAGRGSEADTEERRAVELWESKGATVLAERARRAGDRVLQPAPAPGIASASSKNRRVRSNAATRHSVRAMAALGARNVGNLQGLYSEQLEVVHHPTGTRYGLSEVIEVWRTLWRGRNAHLAQELLASLGETLALARRSTSHEGMETRLGSIGPVEVESFVVLEVDTTERAVRSDQFAGDKLGDAVARLYERYAEQLPEGPERERAAAVARSISVLLVGEVNVERHATALEPSLEAVDHRNVGYGVLHGAEAYLRSFGTYLELSRERSGRVDDVLALGADVLLRRSTRLGTSRASGGEYEINVLLLDLFGADGRLARRETFDADREAEALARFDDLTLTAGSTGPVRRLVRANTSLATVTALEAAVAARVGGLEPELPTERFANAASRAHDDLMRCFNVRDWAGVLASVASQFEFDERRRMMRVKVGAQDWLTMFRFVFDVPESRFEWDLIATRGERLCLHRHRFAGHVADGGGPLAIDEHLALHEIDRDGRFVAVVLFDLEREDAAHAELDLRFEASREAEHGCVLTETRAWRSRDFEAFIAEHAPDLEVHDHRRLGFGSMHGVEAWARMARSLVDLAPDFTIWIDHLRATAHGSLREQRIVGTRDGGAFELATLRVTQLDRSGKIRRIDFHDLDHFDAARARFAELDAPAAPPPRFANAATRLNDRLQQAWAARDWDAIAALHASGRLDDRRRLMRIQVSGGTGMAQLRTLFDVPRSHWVITPIATYGERLALSRVRFRGDVDEEGGSLEIEYLVVDEVDDDGRSVDVVQLDPEDLDAARAELGARWLSGLRAANAPSSSFVTHFADALGRRDWAGLSALMAPDLVAYDHRLASWGTLRGPEGFLESMRAMVALSPDAQLRTDHVRATDYAWLSDGVWVGTRDGGAFESAVLSITEGDAQGRVRRIDFYDPQHVDRALARFEEIVSSTRSASPPPARFANEASRALERSAACFNARDWEGMVASFAPGHEMDDRRKLMWLRVSGEVFLSNERMLFEIPGSRWQTDLVATRGERLALCRVRFFAAGEDAGPLEVEALDLIEVDATGRRTALVSFDLDDADAARDELDARYAAGEAASHPRAYACLSSYLRAFAARDWDAAAALWAPDLVSRNHRLVGWGTLLGPAALISTMLAQVELAPDTRERVDHVRTCERGVLWESAWHGTREGGSFENLWIVFVELDAAGLGRRVDVWDAGQLDQARALFDELCRSATSARG